MIPAEITHSSPHVANYDESSQDERRTDDVNFLEEYRRRVVIRNVRYQHSLRHYHQRRVRPCTLQAGDLVLRRGQPHEEKDKLSPMWEGPFLVMKVARPGSARHASENDIEKPNAWNIKHLRKFYP